MPDVTLTVFEAVVPFVFVGWLCRMVFALWTDAGSR